MVNIKEVAKKAKVSTTTVSRYLNNHPYISKDKKEKIKEAMQILDYIPNSAATQLRSNKSFTIGIIISRISNPYFASLINSIEKYLINTKYHTLIMQSHDDKDEEIRLMDMLKQKQIDGIIMGSMENNLSQVESYTKYGPIVSIGDKSLNSNKVGIVHINYKQATFKAINYLIEKGYKEIGYCTGGSFLKSHHGASRNMGFEEAMMKNKLEINNKYIFTHTHTIQDGIEVGKKLLKNKNLPQAVFTGSDEVATGLMQYLIEKNINIPKTIAIMGFDNQPYSKLLKIPLTTVNQPIDKIALRLVELLLNLLDKTDFKKNKCLIELDIVEREST